MPNTPCLVSEGACGFSMGSHGTAEDRDMVQRLMGAVGLACEVKETLLDGEIVLEGVLYGGGGRRDLRVTGQGFRRWLGLCEIEKGTEEQCGSRNEAEGEVSKARHPDSAEPPRYLTTSRLRVILYVYSRSNQTVLRYDTYFRRRDRGER